MDGCASYALSRKMDVLTLCTSNRQASNVIDLFNQWPARVNYTKLAVTMVT
jgi:hypothetical protein